MANKSSAEDDFRESLKAADPCIDECLLWPVDELPMGDIARSITATEQPESSLIAALARAAVAAAQEGAKCRTELEAPDYEQSKRSVDAAATLAAEDILDSLHLGLVVRAGEGERDSSAGAVLGQKFGDTSTASVGAVIDYVDGTGLVACGLPNALALGATADEIIAIPDVTVFAVLAPRSVVQDLDILANPYDVADQAVSMTAAHFGRSVDQIVLLTHSPDIGAGQLWYSMLGPPSGRVIIPRPISVEAPMMLAMSRNLEDAPHLMVGVIGLVELMYAAIMLDIVGSELTFAYRVVGAQDVKDWFDAPGERAPVLDSAEIDRLGRASVDHRAGLRSDDAFPRGAGRMAAFFSITGGERFGIQPPTRSSVDGLIVSKGGFVSGVTITYRDQLGTLA